MRRIVRTLAVSMSVSLSALMVPAPAAATFHMSHISEVMTGYNGSSDVQFVEILMRAAGQNLVKGTKLNTFDAQGNFVATVLMVPDNVKSGAGFPWLMGTPAFETATGLQTDFEFPNSSLPRDGGMICWGKPGTTPLPVSCPASGTPYVDCLAYGTYSGPTNNCIGTPNAIAPDGHSLRRISRTANNAADFECATPADPHNNSNFTVSMPATTPCPGASSTSTTTSVPQTTSTTAPPGSVCGDPTGDHSITASDALFTLRAAVGATTCALSVCDVDDNGTVSAADALRILALAVGQSVELNCPSA